MVDKKGVTDGQELRETLQELVRTGRAMMDDGTECTLEGMTTKSYLVTGARAVEFAVALRAAEAALKEKGE